MDIVKGSFLLLAAYMIVQLVLFTLAVSSCMWGMWHHDIYGMCTKERFSVWVHEWDRSLELLLSLIAGRALSR